jgi:hypothetical protein
MFDFAIAGATHSCPTGLHEVTVDRAVEWTAFRSQQVSTPVIARKVRGPGIRGFFTPRTVQIASHPSLLTAHNDRMRAEVGYWLRIAPATLSQITQEDVNRIHAFIAARFNDTSTVLDGFSLEVNGPAMLDPAALAQAMPGSTLQGSLSSLIQRHSGPISNLEAGRITMLTVLSIRKTLLLHHSQALRSEAGTAFSQQVARIMRGDFITHLPIITY